MRRGDAVPLPARGADVISLAEVWARPEEQNLLEQGVRQAAGQLRLGDVWPKPMVRYREDPVRFAVEILGIPEHTIRWSLNPGYGAHRWDGTPDPLVEMVEALARGEDVGVEAGTGTAKSYTLGWAYLWFIACWEDARVFTFATTEKQLRLFSWMELRKRFWRPFLRHFPLAELTDLRLRMIPGSDQWGVFGYAAQVRADEEVAAAAKGQHSEHQLIVYEEMQGIDPAVVEAGTHTSTGEHNLRVGVGNPGHQHDALHVYCTRKSVRHVRISALDVPNVVCRDASILPGAASLKSVARVAEDYGEDSPTYRAQVRGISPEEAQDALIKAIWVREAFRRYEDEELRRALEAQGLPALAVDVADKDGGDEAAIARGLGAVCHEVVSFPVGLSHDVIDASVLGANVATEAALEGVLEEHIGVDPVGNGASAVNKLRELGFNVPSLNGGENARPRIDEDLYREERKGLRPEELYKNLRAQMHWQLRLDLMHGRIAIAPDEELLRDLTTPLWERRDGKILVEPKEKIRKRLGRSPNKGDALVYWNFVRYRRELPPDDTPIRAWDQEVLQHQARESRRVRSKPPVRPARVNPLVLESVP